MRSFFKKSFNKHINKYIKNKVINIVDQDELANLFYHNDGEKLNEKLERGDSIYKHFKNLNQKQREVMYLRIVEGLSYDQISKRLKISSSTARGKFRTAKMIIMNKINKKGKSWNVN